MRVIESADGAGKGRLAPPRFDIFADGSGFSYRLVVENGNLTPGVEHYCSVQFFPGAPLGDIVVQDTTIDNTLDEKAIFGLYREPTPDELLEFMKAVGENEEFNPVYTELIRRVTRRVLGDQIQTRLAMMDKV